MRQLDRALASPSPARCRPPGVAAGERVGLLLERDIDLLPALLGAWRAGACYVPLDPAFPAERLAYMASDAGLALRPAHAVPGRTRWAAR